MDVPKIQEIVPPVPPLSSLLERMEPLHNQGWFHAICFCGRMGAGKTESAKMMLEYIHNRQPDAPNVPIKFAGPIYHICRLMGMEDKNRQLLQDIGHLGRTLVDEDIWVRHSLHKMARYIEVVGRPIYFVFDDTRHLNEFHIMKELGSSLIKVTAPEDVRRERCGEHWSSRPHASEGELDNVPDDKFRCVIDNSSDSIEDLEDQVSCALNALPMLKYE
jgi:hypothetical protein